MKRSLIRFPALGVVWAAAGLLSCSQRKESMPADNAVKVQVALGENEKMLSGTKVAVYAFKHDGSGKYCYSRTIVEDWDGNGTSVLRLPEGEYKFHYSCCDKSALTIDPVPNEATEIGMVGYRVFPETTGSGYLPCGELFLQKSDSKPDSVYRIGSGAVNVQAELERVVSRVDVVVKQGQANGTGFTPVPFPAGNSVLDRIGSIRLEVSGVGQRICGTGTSGSATHSVKLDAEDCLDVSPEGFALFRGPMVLPPPEGGEVAVEVSVLPLAKAAQELPVGTFRSVLPKNKRLQLTVWLSPEQEAVEVPVAVTVDLKPMARLEEGESGIWD